MRQYLKCLMLGSIGGLFYIVLEFLWRGYSHWTMFILGGLCFVFVGLVNEWIPWCMPLWKQMLIGVAVITSMEFLTGCIVNLWFGWNIWDYSRLPGNILGQICPQYMLLWLLVALTAIMLDDWFRFWMFQEEQPHYCFWEHREG